MSFISSLAVRNASVSVDTIATLDPDVAGGRVVVAVSFAAPAGSAAKRPVVLVMAGQHGDERAGVEAALMLVRDLAAGRADSLLRDLDIRVVPIVNPWGLDNGIRHNEDGLDLNRDHMLLKSTALQGLHAAFSGRVSAVLDLHELGPVVYDIEVGVPTHPNVDRGLVEFARFYVLPYVANRLAGAGLSFHDYLVQVPPVDEIQEGIEATPDSAVFITYAPIAANNARNVFALGGAASFLVEVTSTRAIDGFESRSLAMRETVAAFLETLASQSEELDARVGAARATREQSRLVLRASNEADPNRPTLSLRVRSEFGTPTNGTIQNWRPVVRPLLDIAVPTAYLVDASETDLVSLAMRHGIRVARVLQPTGLPAASYSSRALPPKSADGTTVSVAEPIDADGLLEWSTRTVAAGDFLIEADQPAGRLLWTLFEPWSQDGWFAATAGDPYPVYRLREALGPASVTPVDGSRP